MESNGIFSFKPFVRRPSAPSAPPAPQAPPVLRAAASIGTAAPARPLPAPIALNELLPQLSNEPQHRGPDPPSLPKPPPPTALPVSLKNLSPIPEESLEDSNPEQLLPSSELSNAIETSSDFDDSELSVVDYARYYGLTTCYRDEHGMNFNIPLPTPEPSSDLPTLEEICGVPAASLEKERLTLDKETASVLKHVKRLVERPRTPESDLGLECSVRQLKLELPLLSTDNEIDVKDFNDTTELGLLEIDLPLAPVDIEKDEGLEWPSSALSLPKVWHRKAEGEKLTALKESLLYLQEVVKAPEKPDVDVFAEGEVKYKRNEAREPVTPPLMHSPPPGEHLVPDSPFLALELLTEDDVSSPSAEVKRFEEDIMKNDTIVLLQHNQDSEGGIELPIEGSVSPANNNSPLKDYSTLPSSPIRKRPMMDLRVEMPLTPPGKAKKPKTVSFPEVVHAYIPDLPSTFEDGNDAIGSQESFDAFFDEIVVPIAEKVDRELQQEQLTETDTVRRVDVPFMDFSLPTPPWEVFSLKNRSELQESFTELDAQRGLLVQLKQAIPEKMQSWPRLSELELRLPWEPFPKELAKVVLDEDLHAAQEALALLRVTEEGETSPIDTDSLVWKPDGWRILDDLHEDDEEELEPVKYPPDPKDLDSIVRTRKRKIDEEDEGASLSKAPPAIETPAAMRRRTIPQSPLSDDSPRALGLVAPAPSISAGGLLGDIFSVSGALEKYMALQGKECDDPQYRKDLATLVEGHKMRVAQLAAGNLLQPTSAPPMPAPAPAETRQHPQVVIEPHEAEPAPNLLPPLPVPENPAAVSIIMSCTICPRRQLLRALAQLNPQLERLERDYLSPLSPAPEADIILSPSTGVLLTTLPKIKQRPLPGQPRGKPPAPAIGVEGMTERLRVLGGRYERLVVLVSEGRTAPGAVRELDASDCEAIGELVAAAAVMAGEVGVSYVPGGDEEVARWVVSLTERYGERDAKVLEEETLWELWLRRLGLNAFAAQMVLGALKRPDEEEGVRDIVGEGGFGAQPREVDVEMGTKDGTLYGLPTFVTMGSAERLERFEKMMGGRRVLEGVNRKLEERWVCAADLGV